MLTAESRRVGHFCAYLWIEGWALMGEVRASRHRPARRLWRAAVSVHTRQSVTVPCWSAGQSLREYDAQISGLITLCSRAG